MLQACTVERSRRRSWRGEMASGEGLGRRSSLWEDLAAGTAGEATPVEVRIALRLELPNRRIRDPYVRWCGRGEAVRPLPIPIRHFRPPFPKQ